MFGLFRRRNKASWTDRKFYSARLEKILTNPSLEDLESAYLLTYTEANDTNLNDLISYIEQRHYLKLSFIKNRLPYFEGEFGEEIGTNLYDIYLLIDRHKQYYLALVYNQWLGEYKEELKFIKPVKSFWYQLYFSHRRLVYPVE